MDVYIPTYTRTKKSSSKSDSDYFDRKPKDNNSVSDMFVAPLTAIPSSIGMPIPDLDPFPVVCKCGWQGMDGELLCLQSSDMLWCPKCKRSDWTFL